MWTTASRLLLCCQLSWRQAVASRGIDWASRPAGEGRVSNLLWHGGSDRGGVAGRHRAALAILSIEPTRCRATALMLAKEARSCVLRCYRSHSWALACGHRSCPLLTFVTAEEGQYCCPACCWSFHRWAVAGRLAGLGLLLARNGGCFQGC